MSGQQPSLNNNTPQYHQQHPHPQQHQPQQQSQQQQQQHHHSIHNKPFPTKVSASMRDRQSRGKDAYGKSDEESADEDEETNQLIAGRGEDEHDDDTDTVRSSKAEPFETRERRAYALAVLDRPELLMMYAQTTNDSIASQRQRFTAMLCGYDEETDWKNNTHYKATMAAAQDRQQKLRKSMNVDRRVG
ncbi:hypothetical protein V8C37DRAFT_401018 [Trichoderma ceciliae]